MNVDIIYFSPTGSTKKYAESIATGLNANINFHNITTAKARKKPFTSFGDIVVWAFSVYGRRIPEVVLNYLRTLHGNKTPLAVAAIYGNITAGISLKQATHLAGKQNFCLFGAATFVGQHTYANHDIDVALGRPDKNDLADAKRFGNLLREKWEHNDFELPQIKTSLLPLLIEELPYNGVRFPIKQPVVNMDKCINCQICQTVCPINAISIDNLQIEEKKCLRCYACVKKCPKDARCRAFRFSSMGKIFAIKGRNPKQNKIYY